MILSSFSSFIDVNINVRGKYRYVSGKKVFCTTKLL